MLRRGADPADERGRPRRYEKLYRRYARPVFGLALRRLGDRGPGRGRGAGDVRLGLALGLDVQARARPGRAVALRRRAQRDRRPQPRTHRAAGRGAGRGLARARRRRIAPSRRGRAGRCIGALEQLPEREREVLALAYWSDLSQSEVAARLGIPLGTVKTRTRSALQRLATILEGELSERGFEMTGVSRTEFDDLVDADGLSPAERARLEQASRDARRRRARRPTCRQPCGSRRAAARRVRSDENVVRFPPGSRADAGRRWALIAAPPSRLRSLASAAATRSATTRLERRTVVRVVPLAGSGARASVSLNRVQPGGNWPMDLTVTGLPKQTSDRAYYELFVWRNGKPASRAAASSGARHDDRRLHRSVRAQPGTTWS